MTDEMRDPSSGRSAVAAPIGRSEVAAVLLALIPVSAFIALLVLLAMAANVASATGGCGGG